MPKKVTQYSVLIASPSDVLNERRVIRQVIHDWNASVGLVQGINLSPVMWETHATPEMGDRPQAIINRQLVEDCDILVGVFWMRLGSPTGVAESGSAEEISICLEAGKPVLIYFSSMAVKPCEIDLDQHRKLLDFKGVCRQKGLQGDFDTIEELRVKIHADLTRVANWLHKKTLAEDAAEKASLPPVVDKELPDDDEAGAKEANTARVPYEQLAKRDRDFLRAKAIKMLTAQGATSIGPNATNSMAMGLYREQTRTVEDLRHEFLAGKREAMRQERQTEDARKAGSRMPKKGNK